jgi:hypothetical protein
MKQVRFCVHPFVNYELTTFVSDEDWQSYQDNLEHGENADFVFQRLLDTHDFTHGQMTILPSYEAMDIEWVDCDCKEAKKPLVREE